ncbi:dihydrofolate reductase [Streptococcus caprae]|uniref:Dihydrofolate reductase n=1 Tax=Streptococcus caprae TaxID=1640501 RepID=A0ABV8CUU0_9STRE
MTKRIIAIWAEDENHLIGKEDRLPWRLPKELAHFKETTMGSALLMGRVTFDGMNRRILPGRETLILSRQAFVYEGVTVVTSLEAALDWYGQQEKSLFIVGGASIYKAFEPYYDELLVTKVHGKFEGDTYFPDFDFSSFELAGQEFFAKDEKNSHDFTVYHYKRHA